MLGGDYKGYLISVKISVLQLFQDHYLYSEYYERMNTVNASSMVIDVVTFHVLMVCRQIAFVCLIIVVEHDL